MLDIWRETECVRFGDVDRSDRLTLGSVFSFFQEAAISHAADLGVGRDALASTGQAWILSRLSLFIERRPAYGETVEVSTWPRGCEKLFALRDYAIRDSGGIAVVRGRGAWLVLDTEKRRPLRPQPLVETLPPNSGINALKGSGDSTCPTGLKLRENLVKKMEHDALYSDIDFYGHANNARYIQWIQDAADINMLTKAAQIRFDINYLSEVLPGDKVELWTAPLTEPGENEEESSCNDYPSLPGQNFAYEGRRPEAAQAVFRAELRFGFD